MKILVVTVAIVVGCLLSLAPGVADDDVMSSYLDPLRARKRDCGHMTLENRERTAIDACVVESLQEKRPFVVRYDHQGDEATVSWAMVLGASGRLALAHWDAWGCHERSCVKVYPCDQPTVSVQENRLRVQCTNVHEF